jgi:hypothetical protein
MRRIILFELNEVPWRVIDHFVAAHADSALARMVASAVQHETLAEDTLLSPWITWPTLHRGVTSPGSRRRPAPSWCS